MGQFSLTQARGLGYSDDTIEHRLRIGRWIRVAPQTYSLPGHRESWMRSLWRAHLHAGPRSVVSDGAAARLHGFEQVIAGRVVVIVPDRRRHPPPGVRWHRVGDLAPSDVTDRHGLPVTTPARTAVDMASRLHIASLRLLVEQGVAERKFALTEVGAILGRVRRRGKPGVRKLSQVLDDLGPGEGIARSELERRLDAVIARAGLPPPVHEHVLPNERGRRGFVDRCWPEARLIVEADGRKWHHRFQQAMADADRTFEAQALGWETTRLLWEHLHHDPDGTAGLLREVYLQRIRLLSPSS